MYGAIFGDVIGSRFEFDRGGKTKEFKLFTEQDSFTDDTAMTIAVGEGLMNAGPDAIIQEAYYYEKSQGLVINPFGEALTIPKEILGIVLRQLEANSEAEDNE